MFTFDTPFFVVCLHISRLLKICFLLYNLWEYSLVLSFVFSFAFLKLLVYPIHVLLPSRVVKEFYYLFLLNCEAAVVFVVVHYFFVVSWELEEELVWFRIKLAYFFVMRHFIIKFNYLSFYKRGLYLNIMSFGNEFF